MLPSNLSCLCDRGQELKHEAGLELRKNGSLRKCPKRVTLENFVGDADGDDDKSS